MDAAADTTLLLSSEDVPPVHEFNAAGHSPFLLTCDHYGRLIPRILGDLGLPGSELTRHIAWDIIFDPYHRRIDEIIDQRGSAGMPTVLVSLHSFTPVYAGIARPWHIGTLYHRDTHLPPPLLKLLRAEGDLVVGDNEPYAVSDETDYTIPVHGEARGLMNTGIEIRQDLISDPAGEKAWAERLARILGEIEPMLRAQQLLSA